ncbi:hypothetical protein Taro_048031 [Colocasia esculenta]|uniref:Cytochrome P450 n=1 Tax=Colocasia esculenta TaxID=4460 RepID=A0A843X754_COLES|nr:hypothetical protein [Colocasia esculenta]
MAMAMAVEAAAACVLGRLQALQAFFSIFFFSFSTSFVVFSLLVKLLRSRPWCNCAVCYDYVSGGWSAEFDNLCDWYTHLLRRSSTGTIHVHVLGNTITANPANVEHMLCARFDNYPKGRPFSSILGDLLGRGIFNVDGEHWMFQRKMASLELGSVSVRSYALQIVSSEARQRLLPLLASAATGGRSSDTLDLQDVFRRFSFDCICRISFGLDPGCLELSLPISEFANAFDKASMLSASRAAMASPMVWRLKRLLNLGSEKELKRCIRLIDVLAMEVIKQRRKMGLFSGHDLLSRFMGTVNDDKYLRDIVVSFLLAGRDTVSSTLTTFFLLLSEHPEVEKAILEEIHRVMGEDGGENNIPSYDQLKDMHYVHAALHESMRLYPPVQFDSKFAVVDDVLPDGTFVAKGTRVTYHPYAMGRMEDAWGADCLHFRPDRWLTDDGSFSPANPNKYPVFQAGPRVCLGKEMAVMEMKCVVVAVVREFRLQPLTPAHHPKFAPGLTATLRGGLPVRVARRRTFPPP